MFTPIERAFYRLVYPIVCRPELRVGGDAFLVIDLSEQGIRFRAAEGPYPLLGTVFTGQIVLQTAGPVEVEGRIVRIQPPEIGAVLTKGVPFAVMLEEQRYLARRFNGRA